MHWIFSIDQTILLASVAYFGALFVIAWLAERQYLPDWLNDNPLVQVLSLGVFVSAWSFYGVVDLFNQYGYGALSYYMGAGGLFVFAPMILMPLFRLSRTYQLHSLADLLVFRFRSPFVGVLATFCMLLCALPLFALQIQAVADTSLIVSSQPLTSADELFAQHDQLAIIFCVAAVLFAAVFGAGRERHRGLIAAMAVESVVKMVALLAVGLFALRHVFGGFHGLDKWLSLHPEQLETLYKPVENTSSHMLVMLFFTTAIVLPHMFHMGFAENARLRTLRQASWGIPLYLLLLSLPMLPILWAGFAGGTAVTPEYYTLGVPLAAGQTGLTALAYIGGLSAAIGTTVVMAVALSTMCLNHWLLPQYRPPKYRPIAGMTDLYGLITWLRRVLMALIVLGGYLFYRLLQNGQTLTDLAILSFIGSLQFLPGVFAVLYGQRANRRGLITGLSAGMLIWIVCLLLPTLLGWRLLLLPGFDVALRLGVENWSQLTVIAISTNIFLFVLVSRLSHTSPEEQRAAEQCSMDEVARPLRLELDVRSVAEIGDRLNAALGPETARQELQRALTDIDQTPDDARPYALRRLRDRLEANLSGLMGAAVAHALMDRAVPYHTAAAAPLKEDLHFVENRINQYRHHLTGLAGELDKLRRHHRETLESLPMAVCSLGDDGEVLLWNRAMTELTGIGVEAVLGSTVITLPEPWGHLINDLLHDPHVHVRKQTIEIRGGTCWLSLHRATLSGGDLADAEGHIIMIDDLTETEQLEQELLHSERLASIGRLAAGVAHEVGNPLTGIDCLAQDLKFESDQPAVREAAAKILGQTARISRIVQSLVHFAHAGKTGEEKQTAVDLFECVEEAIHLLSLQKDRARVHYNNMMAPDTFVLGDEQTLTQLFINLFSNARDASPPESPVDISAVLKNNSIIVRVRDYGYGIAPQHINRVFEPFFTTKPAGQGTGLGLALVYSIVEDHGGHIEVKSPLEDGAGTEFIISFPKSI